MLLGDSGKKWQTCYHIGGIFFAAGDEPIDQKSSKKANLQKSPAIPLGIRAVAVVKMSSMLGLFWGYFCLFLAVFGHKKGAAILLQLLDFQRT